MATREDVLATVLHILSSSTKVSPLTSNDDGTVYVHFSPHCSRSSKNEGHDNTDHLPCPSHFKDDDDVQRSAIYLEQFLKRIFGAETNASVVDAVMSVMVDFSRENAVVIGDSLKAHDDNVIWEAGLKLIHHTISDEKYGTLDDEPISPHIILSAVMDSYYCLDSDPESQQTHDYEQGGSSDQQPNDETQAQHLSTSLAMFYLRSLIASVAIEEAANLTLKSIASSSTTSIRWRRLKSMIDDITSLFKKILSDQLIAVLAQESDPVKKAIQTMRLISMATSVYVRNIFRACTNLIELLLNNACKSSSDVHFKRRILETSYTCIGTLTSLLALQVVFVEEVELSYSVMHLVLQCIDDQHNDNIFQSMLDEYDSSSNYDQAKTQKFNLWNEIGVKKRERGFDLIQDLLLYPSIRLSYYDIQRSGLAVDRNEDGADDSSDDKNRQETYDLLGIATIAYCMSTGKGHMTLPCPYSKEYRWNLLFPHIQALITGLQSSSTFQSMNKTQLSILNDLNDTKAIDMGLEMLEKLVSTAPTMIGPYSQTRNTPKEKRAIVCFATTLEATIESLLHLVLRLSILESSMRNGSNLEALKYSSQQVMGMARTLLGLYMPDIRIRALASLSRKMRSTDQSKVLLPRVLDWMRPTIMQMCVDRVPSSDDVAIILTIIDALSPFLQEIEFAFDRPNSTLPRNLREFMSPTEANTAFVSIYRVIRRWVTKARSIATNKCTTSNARIDKFHQIDHWVLKSTTVLESFYKSLSNLLEFWSIQSSPEDTPNVDKIDPPSGWHRLFLLLHSLKESLEEI